MEVSCRTSHTKRRVQCKKEGYLLASELYPPDKDGKEEISHIQCEICRSNND